MNLNSHSCILFFIFTNYHMSVPVAINRAIDSRNNGKLNKSMLRTQRGVNFNRMSKLLSPRTQKHIQMDKKYISPRKERIDNSINRLYYSRVTTKSPNRYPSVRSHSNFGSRRGSAISTKSNQNKSYSSHASFRKINRRLEKLNESIGKLMCSLTLQYRPINQFVN